jgi:hypothetical protein
MSGLDGIFLDIVIDIELPNLLKLVVQKDEFLIEPVFLLL